MRLNCQKLLVPTELQKKIIKLIINDISSTLTELYVHTFLHGLFPLILETCEKDAKERNIKDIKKIQKNIYL